MNGEYLLNTADEVGARLTMIEFALEILFAREIASLPAEASEQAKQTFIELMTRPYDETTGEQNESGSVRAISEQTVEFAKQFVHKVSEREAFLRRP